MPVPKPKEGEEQKKFLSRCMGDSVMNSEFPESAQRYAVCMTSWKNKGKKEDKESNKSKEKDGKD